VPSPSAIRSATASRRIILQQIAFGVPLLALGAGLRACSTRPAAAAEVLRGTASRATFTDAQARAGAAGLRQFGSAVLADLLSKEKGNLAISPASIAIALGMTVNGARATTAAQMLDVLRQGVLAATNAHLGAVVASLAKPRRAPPGNRRGCARVAWPS